MFYETAQNYHSDFSDFRPYPTSRDRAGWEALDEAWKQESVRLAESFSAYTFPCISASEFMAFSRTGDRIGYEEKFFKKRQVLSALTLAECIENKGRFLEQIINGIFSVCEESAWQLPAHNTYIRDALQLPLPDVTDPILDLFACETGAVLATVSYLLKEKLDAVSPFITKRIDHILRERIYTPYLNRHFWWMGNGKEPMCNWTIWCTQNVLLSVFLSDRTDAALKRQVFLKACKSTDYFLAEYGEDGCCDEGAQYYHHAGLCLFQVTELLNTVTNGAFAYAFCTPKIQNIAAYIFNVHVDDKYYVNFADCSPIAGRAGAREFLFADRTGQEAMKSFAARDFIAGGHDSLLSAAENNLFYRLQSGFTVTDMRKRAAQVPKSIPHKDIYYPSVGIFIARDDVFCLAVKAGDNGDSHNHNDTGSFTIYKNGRPMFIDIGVENYTKKTFSDRRYEIWTMQSDYHNLPTINGQMQKDGEAYKAVVLSWALTDRSAHMEMDIAGAYPKEAGIACCRRKAELLKNQGIVITDRFAFTEPSAENNVVLNFMTYEKPVVQQSAADGLSIEIGSLGTLSLLGAADAVVEEIPITDSRLKTAWEHEVYRIRAQAKAGEVVMHIQ